MSGQFELYLKQTLQITFLSVLSVCLFRSDVECAICNKLTGIRYTTILKIMANVNLNTETRAIVYLELWSLR